jgi:ferritin-like metal-binding protein YciE
MQAAKMLIAERGADEPLSLGGALMAGKKGAPDAVSFLVQDHEEAFGYFDWYRSATDLATKIAVAKKLCGALRAHMHVEEEIFYPAAEEATGDEGLIAVAVEEHAACRRMVDDIEATAARGDIDDILVDELRAAIAGHVEEEQTKVFPKARAAALDLFAIGRDVAARRVELLFVLSGKYSPQANLKETPKMAVSREEARELFITGLRNAHATEQQCLTMVQNQLARLESYPKVAERMRLHEQEVAAQIGRLEQILESLGESPSTFKDTAMSMMGNVASMMNSAMEDEILKNSFANTAMANFEIAAYESLLQLGEMAGETEAVRLLQRSLNEERDMAAWLAENVRGVTIRFAQRRSEAAQASR